MKRLLLFFLPIVCLISCQKNDGSSIIRNDDSTVDTKLPQPDHIVFVWFENKDYDSIVGNSKAPYINSLIAKGTLFTNMFAITHPSYPNYVDFFAGSPNGVINNNCINSTTLTTPNLYTNLNAVQKTFAWYSEGLPATGSAVCRSGLYVEKHNPTTIFLNVPGTANKRFEDFPTDFTLLENVVCISPDLNNDMHDGTVAEGDAWLKEHLSKLVDWCTTHNSIFVVYFDEDEGTNGNRIPVVAVGENVKEGYRQTTKYDHYDWTRTICAIYGANDSWTSNLSSRDTIMGCWK